MTHPHTEFAIKRRKEIQRRKEKYTIDVYGDGEYFVTPESWYGSVVPSAVEVTVRGNRCKAVGVCMFGSEPPFCWIEINTTTAAKIMAQSQRMQEGVCPANPNSNTSNTV